MIIGKRSTLVKELPVYSASEASSGQWVKKTINRTGLHYQTFNLFNGETFTEGQPFQLYLEFKPPREPHNEQDMPRMRWASGGYWNGMNGPDFDYHSTYPHIIRHYFPEGSNILYHYDVEGVIYDNYNTTDGWAKGWALYRKP